MRELLQHLLQPPARSSSASPLREQGLGRLHRAAARGDLGWLRRWRWYVKVVGIDRPDQEMRTPLHLASANGHADVIRYLLRKNSQPNLADNFKRTALMKAVQQEQEECVAVLLEHGADPNLADADGNTALHLAVLSKNTAVAGLLLEHHAKSDAQNQWGFTPFKLAAFQQHEEMECLLKQAADRPAQAQGERTALVVPGSHEAHLEEDNLCLQKELDRVDAEPREEEEKHLQSEHRVGDLKTALDDKGREARTSSQKLQDVPLASSETNPTVKQLEEDAQDFASGNSRLEATVQQPSDSVEALLRDLQASASGGELSQQLDMEPRTGMQPEAPKQALREELSSLLGKCEKLEKSKCQLQEEMTKLHHRLETLGLDGSQTEQWKREVAERADQEIRLEKLLRIERRKVRVNEEKESQSQLEEMKSRYSEKVKEVDRLQAEQLDRECKQCTQLEAKNQALQEELSALRGKCENLAMDKCQLQEELAKLHHHLETNLVDCSQLEQCKREVEERADQEIRQKLQEVNEFLQAQAAHQDTLEEIRSSHFDSLKKQMEDRIRDLERALGRRKSNQAERPFPKESTQAEVDKYKELYLVEAKTRKSLAKKLERVPAVTPQQHHYGIVGVFSS
ncbi:ankyrin repeat domain-containing protein 26-like [Pipra filicauda]|uniref:Ankyrin repeat domain-containing protein 26-like n=1 Tax=Pipra filicauda TaxID=649802 RepID=A0A7R5L6C8_9PASS|nr:ankyrin repeat domain-containing protein 26-like [Pipra filicauda]